MKRTVFGAIVVAFVSLSLSGCFEAEAEQKPKEQQEAINHDSAAYEPNTFHCQPEYLKTLPDNKAREDLVEKCMTGGSYKKSEPKTW